MNDVMKDAERCWGGRFKVIPTRDRNVIQERKRRIIISNYILNSLEEYSIDRLELRRKTYEYYDPSCSTYISDGPTMIRILLDQHSAYANVNIAILKEESRSIRPHQFGNDVAEMLFHIESKYSEILEEGGIHDNFDYIVNILEALEPVDNPSMNSFRMDTESSWEAGENVLPDEIIEKATKIYYSLLKRKKVTISKDIDLPHSNNMRMSEKVISTFLEENMSLQESNKAEKNFSKISKDVINTLLEENASLQKSVTTPKGNGPRRDKYNLATSRKTNTVPQLRPISTANSYQRRIKKSIFPQLIPLDKSPPQKSTFPQLVPIDKSSPQSPCQDSLIRVTRTTSIPQLTPRRRNTDKITHSQSNFSSLPKSSKGSSLKPSNKKSTGPKGKSNKGSSLKSSYRKRRGTRYKSSPSKDCFL